MEDSLKTIHKDIYFYGKNSVGKFKDFIDFYDFHPQAVERLILVQDILDESFNWEKTQNPSR